MELATVRRLALVAAFGALLVACSDDEDIVPDGQFPTDTVGNFLGYADVEAKGTTCGNCHATFQAGWVETGHADAWEGLQASGHAQEFCEGCHTVSQLGNDEVVDVAWTITGDPRYHDVQCESCHGSGFEHINDPMATQPLCSVVADTAATTGCGECHNGTHHPFVEQWQASGHSNTGFASGRTGCDECHEGRVALVRKFFETSNYIEKNGTEVQPINCVVCHDPHDNTYTHQVRAPIDLGTADAFPSTSHLCYQCHSRRGTPPSTHGPHAAQGPLVFQEDIGWLPAGFDAPPLSSHGDPDANPEACVTCHMASFEVLDDASEFLFQSVGHLFEPLPCLDAEGIPVAGDCDVADRTFVACTGCHSEAQARQIYADIRADLKVWLDSLWFDVDSDGELDPGTDTGLLPQVAALDTVQLDPRDNLITVGEGAFWNAQIAHTDEQPWWEDAVVYPGVAGEGQAGVHWSAHRASGSGVHAPAFLRALLEASVDAVLAEYFSP
jgi:hypothetical protein